MLNLIRDFFDPAVFGGAKRSSKWGKTKRAFAKASPKVCPCSATKKIELHHIEPFHIAPEKELDFDNLIWLCHTCHFYFGHLKNYRSWNVRIYEHMHEFQVRVENRP